MKTIKIPALFTMSCLLLLTGCIKKVKRTIIKEKKQKTITVWIHGSRILPEFYPQEIFYSPAGMHAALDLDAHRYKRKYAKLLTEKDPKRFQEEDFYAYGWSGKIKFEERETVARDLYQELKKLQKEYKQQYGTIPRIRLITHSHGGNVALNLATVKNPDDTEFSVDELILLACPVQEKTKYLIDDPTFERIYSLYSRGDLIQCIDPQKLHKVNRHDPNCPLFSERRFPPHKKLSQAKIKSWGRGIMHLEFLFLTFVSHLSRFLDMMDTDYIERDDSYKPENIQHDFLVLDIHKTSFKKKFKLHK